MKRTAAPLISAWQQQETYNPLNQEESGVVKLPNMWTNSVEKRFKPVWISRPILASFAVSFAAIIAALEVISHFSSEGKGLTTPQANLHYLWVYGPTTGKLLLTIQIFESNVEQSVHDPPCALEQS